MKTKSKPKLQDVLKSECEILFKQAKQNFWYFLIAVFFVWGCSMIFKPIFNKVDFLDVISSEIWDRFVLGLSLLVIARHFVWALNDYILSRLYEFVVLVVLFVYLNYRIIDTDYWIFSTFTWNKSVFYLDIILGSPFLGIVMVRAKRLRNSIKRSTGNPLNNSLITHTSAESDGYKRSPSAKEFMDIILQSEDENAIAVGIVGPWGAGKSWYMAKMEERVTEKYSDTHVVIKMNPWKSSTGQDIIVQFLNTLKDNLAVNNGNFNRLIDSYIKSITQIDKTNSLSTFISNWGKSETEDDEHKMIQNELAKNNKRFVIFIDDIDRLGDSEVMEVLKLIRNTANFKGVYYVVGYDKSQLLMAISKKFKHKHEKFLDKIFQIEKELSIIPSYLIKNEFISEWTKFVNSDFFNEDDSIDIVNQSLNITDGLKGIGHAKYLAAIFDITIKNKRELLKLVNSFKLKVIYLRRERIDLVQLLILDILNLSDYKSYRGLQELSGGLIKIDDKNSKYNFVEDPDIVALYFDRKKDDSFYDWVLSMNVISIGQKIMKILFYKDEDATTYGKIYSTQYFNSFFEFSGALTSSIFIKEFLESENVDVDSKIEQYTEDGQLNELVKIVKDEGLKIVPNDTVKFEKFINIIEALSVKSNEGLLNESYFDSSKLDELYKDNKLVRWKFIAKVSLEVSHLNKYVVWATEMKELHNSKKPLEAIEDCILRFEDDNFYKVQYGDKWRELIKNKIKEFDLIEQMIQRLFFLESNLYSIREEYKILFREYDELEKFVRESEASFLQQEFLTFYRRFQANNYEPIEFTRGTIEIISSSETEFCGSLTYYKKMSRQKSVQFIHPNFQGRIETTSPLFRNVPWIAMTEKIDNKEEQFYGDTYIFKRNFKVDFFECVSSFTLRFFVDDELVVSRINGLVLFENIETGDHNMAIKTFETSEVIKRENELHFTVRNKSFSEIGAGGREVVSIRPGENPYGITYVLELHYNMEKLKKEKVYELW